MKRVNFTLVALIICAILSSCSKNENDNKDTVFNNETEHQQKTYLQKSDLQGVWDVMGYSGIYFISFTETGHYSLCFNSKLMGAGTYTIEKNILTLNNGYLFSKDVLSVEKEGNLLKITGDMKSFKSSEKQTVNVNLAKTAKEIPVPKTGEIFKIWGLHATYGDVVTKYNINQII